MIPKIATKVGTLRFKAHDRLNDIYLHYNLNTGEPVIYQKLQGSRATSTSGRNLLRFVQDLQEALYEGEASWTEAPNDAALDAMRKFT